MLGGLVESIVPAITGSIGSMIGGEFGFSPQLAGVMGAGLGSLIMGQGPEGAVLTGIGALAGGKMMGESEMFSDQTAGATFGLGGDTGLGITAGVGLGGLVGSMLAQQAAREQAQQERMMKNMMSGGGGSAEPWDFAGRGSPRPVRTNLRRYGAGGERRFF